MLRYKTRMWRFSILGYPVTVEPWFWLTSFLLGRGLSVSNGSDLALVLIWMVVVFVSILVHELGHAMAARNYGAYPEIRLHGLGGLTIMPAGYFNRAQSIFVSAAGPMAGLALGGLVWLIDKAYPPHSDPLIALVGMLMWVNFFWTFVNLLPILPLDGGQILRDLLGPGRHQIASWIGVLCAAGAAIWAFNMGRIFLAIMMLFLAYGNFQNQNLMGGIRRG